jgi:hypothetical protein
MIRTILAWCSPGALAWILFGALAAAQQPSPPPDFRAWRGHGECWILTDAEGAALPANASVADFPLLLRLRQGVFDFAAAQPHGEDLRITDDAGAALGVCATKGHAARHASSRPEARGRSSANPPIRLRSSASPRTRIHAPDRRAFRDADS